MRSVTDTELVTVARGTTEAPAGRAQMAVARLEGRAKLWVVRGVEMEAVGGRGGAAAAAGVGRRRAMAAVARRARLRRGLSGAEADMVREEGRGSGIVRREHGRTRVGRRETRVAGGRNAAFMMRRFGGDGRGRDEGGMTQKVEGCFKDVV